MSYLRFFETVKNENWYVEVSRDTAGCIIDSLPYPKIKTTDTYEIIPGTDDVEGQLPLAPQSTMYTRYATFMPSPVPLNGYVPVTIADGETYPVHYVEYRADHNGELYVYLNKHRTVKPSDANISNVIEEYAQLLNEVMVQQVKVDYRFEKAYRDAYGNRELLTISEIIDLIARVLDITDDDLDEYIDPINPFPFNANGFDSSDDSSIRAYKISKIVYIDNNLRMSRIDRYTVAGPRLPAMWYCGEHSTTLSLDDNDD